jgi:hypothetical protein
MFGIKKFLKRKKADKFQSIWAAAISELKSDPAVVEALHAHHQLLNEKKVEWVDCFGWTKNYNVLFAVENGRGDHFVLSVLPDLEYVRIDKCTPPDRYRTVTEEMSDYVFNEGTNGKDFIKKYFREAAQFVWKAKLENEVEETVKAHPHIQTKVTEKEGVYTLLVGVEGVVENQDYISTGLQIYAEEPFNLKDLTAIEVGDKGIVLSDKQKENVKGAIDAVARRTEDYKDELDVYFIKPCLPHRVSVVKTPVTNALQPVVVNFDQFSGVTATLIPDEDSIQSTPGQLVVLLPQPSRELTLNGVTLDDKQLAVVTDKFRGLAKIPSNVIRDYNTAMMRKHGADTPTL